ncbi:hypothetical protein [Neobacillus piezotolerans]|nr:hypothetical protein [Neobacillus piezotolerans]
MWIITAYKDKTISMYEFEDEKEARESFEWFEGTKILSHVIYYNDEI